MARDGSGVYSLPANTLAVSGDPISSTKFNSLVQDVEADLNVDRPIAAGGTGSSTAAGALTNLFSGASPGGADKIAFWDQSATSFGWLSLGTGLTFSGTTLALDADLVTLAGLTPTANNFIVGNAGGTAWEVKTPADARTALGLGTAAVVNTGTSGGTVPLLNAANTFSAAQAFVGGNIVNGTAGTNRQWLYQSAGVNRWAYGMDTGDDFIFGRFDTGGAFQEIVLSFDDTTGAGTFSDTPTVAGSTIWHAGNDGAGSGLDADTLDGVQGSAFAQLSGATFTGDVNFSGYKNIRYVTGNAYGRISARYDVTGAAHDHMFWSVNYLRNASGSGGAVDIAALGTVEVEARGTNAGPGYFAIRTGAPNTAPTDRVVVDNTGFQAKPAVSAETSGTLTAASANKTIQATGDITIDNSVFAAGDITLIYAGASARTITQGSGVTIRLGGSATTGSRTLAARGVAMLFFVSASEVVVSGSGVT